VTARHRELGSRELVFGKRSDHVTRLTTNLGNHLDARGQDPLLQIVRDGAAYQDINTELAESLDTVVSQRMILDRSGLPAEDLDDRQVARNIENR
jgi:hypothetical protein